MEWVDKGSVWQAVRDREGRGGDERRVAKDTRW
jgi:hypothetical protein